MEQEMEKMIEKCLDKRLKEQHKEWEKEMKEIAKREFEEWMKMIQNKKSSIEKKSNSV